MAKRWSLGAASVPVTVLSALLAALLLALLTAMSAGAEVPLAGQTVRIGLGGPFTTGSASFGLEMRHAVELAVAERNAAGGILGARVEITAADAETSRQIARAFCADLTVLGVVGHVNSGVTLAASEIYHDCRLAMITPMASNPAVTERGLDNVFRLTTRDDRKGPALAAYLFGTVGKQQAVVVDDQTAYGRGLADSFAESFTALGGQVLARRSITVGETDFRPMLRSLPEGFDVLMFGGIAEAAPLVRQMRELGDRQLFACGDGCWSVSGFLQPAQGAASQGEGALILSAAPALGTVPGSADFASGYTAQYGPIANYAANSYDSARLLMAAIESAAAVRQAMPTREEVLCAMHSITFQGIAYARPVDWDEKGDNRAAVSFVNTVEGDHFREVAQISRAD